MTKYIRHYTMDCVDGEWVDVAGVLVCNSQGDVIFKKHIVLDKDVTSQEKVDKLREVYASHIVIDLKEYVALRDILPFISLHGNNKLFQLYKYKYQKDVYITDLFVKNAEYLWDNSAIEKLVEHTIHISEVYTTPNMKDSK